MRIVHLNSLLTGGGTDDQCVKLAQQLGKLNQQVWLAGPDGREFSKIAKAAKVPFCPTSRDSSSKLRFVLGAARAIRESQAEIVHGHHGRDLWPTIFAARLSRVRPVIVLSRHLAKSPSSWVSRRFLLGRSDAIIAVSGFVARVLKEGVYEPNSPEPERRSRPPLCGDHSKIHVIHGGIDTTRFQPADASGQRAAWNLKSEHFVFGVAGGYDLPRGKGQREFLKAAALVHQQIPHARFLIIGRGSMRELLEADLKQLDLTEKAWLAPWTQDMPAAMNALDCLVHPQIGTEAFPGVVLEAFACGRPVIASRLDGIPEAFDAGAIGRLVTPEDVMELAAAMVERANLRPPDNAQRSALHDRIARNFSLEVTARKTLELYSKLLRPA